MQPTDPFDKHPGSPLALEHRADTLVRLAAEATDLEALTNAAFSPAQASWEGVAAPELRAAPEPLRIDAGRVASKVAWAAVPLLVWAKHVREFNRTVDWLRARYGVVPAEVERRVREWYPDLDEKMDRLQDILRGRVREALIRELKQEWYDALDLHIDEGARAVASMFQHGPSWDNLAIAQQLGVMPAGPLVAFLGGEWQWQATVQEAQRILGGLGSGESISDEEIARLAKIMKDHAADQEFAFLVLDELGPAGLIEANIGLVVLANGGEHDLDQLVAIQQGLGVALATATTRRGEYGSAPWGDREQYYPAERELPPDWAHDLAAAGRERYPSHPDGMTSERLYGYQLLGPLLAHGQHDEWFLGVVGGDLIDFEMELGGSEIWQGTYSTGPLDLTRLQTGDNPTFSYDPMVGLMEAFDTNPYGARAAFTGSVVALEGGGSHLPRVDYLVTDRYWGTNVVDGGIGLDTFGRVLEHATGITAVAGTDGQIQQSYPPDERSHQIVAAIVQAIGADETVTQTSIEDRDVVPDALRPHLARIAAGYIDDIHWGAIGGHRADSLPGEQDVLFAPRDLEVFLAELGRNPEARTTVALAQEFYLGVLYDYYLSGAGGHDDPFQAARNNAIEPAAFVFAALDLGAAAQIDVQLDAQVAAHNLELDHRELAFQLGARLVGDVVEAGPLPSGTIVYLLDQMLGAPIDGERVAPPVGQADWEIGSMLALSEQRMSDQAVLAVYRHLDPDELPEILVVDGELKPIEDWYGRLNSPERIAWGRYISDSGADSLARTLAVDAAKRYDDAYQAANERLAGSRLAP